MTFEDIQKANATIQTMTIEKKTKNGKVTQKEYAEVNQRIKAFRSLYPEGFITTQLVRDEDGVCVFKASVGFYENGEPIILGTGTAYEKEGSSFINQTSYIENAETSAVGRALGMCGIGIDTSVASYEEVQNAMLNQQVSDAELAVLTALCTDKGIHIGKLCAQYKVETPEMLTGAMYADIMRRIKEGEKK